MSVYSFADKAIRDMNRRNLKAFTRLKLADFDEINLIKTVGAVYDASARYAKKEYLKIARDAYCSALISAGISEKQALDMAADSIDADWILDMLEEVDKVTLYAFIPETDRKKQRLIEALSAAQNRNYEIEKALRYWVVQIGQYAINTVDRARLDAFKAIGVKRVRWVSEKDQRVCDSCNKLDGKVFAINNVPPKQHYQCRCHLHCLS